MQAGFLLDFICEEMGPYYYNQGVQDAQQLAREKLEDAVYEIEKPFVDWGDWWLSRLPPDRFAVCPPPKGAEGTRARLLFPLGGRRSRSVP